MDDLLTEFLAETNEGLSALDSALLRLEKAPDDKLVLLSLNWSMGTTGENWPQTEGLI